MLTSSSSLFASLEDGNSVEAGVFLPYHDDVYGAPKNTLADGASLWVSGDLKTSEIKGVAKVCELPAWAGGSGEPDFGRGVPAFDSCSSRSSTAICCNRAWLACKSHINFQLHGKTVLPKLRAAQMESVRSILEEEPMPSGLIANRPRRRLTGAVMRATSRLVTDKGGAKCQVKDVNLLFLLAVCYTIGVCLLCSHALMRMWMSHVYRQTRRMKS